MILRMVYKSGQNFFRFVTNHAFDSQPYRRTDGQTDSFLTDRPRCMQRGKTFWSLFF